MEQFIPRAIEFASNHSLMVLAWVLVFVATIFTIFRSATSGVKIADNTTATLLINKQDAVVVDMRSDKEFEAGHIVDSLHIVPEEIKEENLGALDKHKERPIILVDATGASYETAAKQLHKQGFVTVYALKEGIAAWRSANLPLVKKH